MKKIFEDHLNLKIMELLCEGEGVTVNTTELSKVLGRHRNTIKNNIYKLFEHKIIEKPSYPFSHLFKEWPLLVIEKANFRRDLKTNTFIEKDPVIWAAFFVKENDYNTLLIEFHKDLYSYQNWRESIITEGKITLEERNYPSETIFLTMRNLIKYDPTTSVQIIETNFKNNRHTQINGLRINEFQLELIKLLLTGKGINTNENHLGNILNVHRRTVKRRIEKLLDQKILNNPVCCFPRVWVPPEYFLVFSLFEVKKNYDLLQRTLKNDPHIPILFRAIIDKFNLALFGNFYKMEDFLEWAEDYDQRLPGCIGAVKNTFLSPTMTFSIAHNYVTLTYIQNIINRLHGKALVEMMKGD